MREKEGNFVSAQKKPDRLFSALSRNIDVPLNLSTTLRSVWSRLVPENNFEVKNKVHKAPINLVCRTLGKE